MIAGLGRMSVLIRAVKTTSVNHALAQSKHDWPIIDLGTMAGVVFRKSRPLIMATIQFVQHQSSFMFQQLARAAAKLHHELFDSYRPEKHYMRGPGPKCREKARQAKAQ